MNQTKLEHLTAFVLANLPGIHGNQLDAWQESGSLEISGEDRGNGGIRPAYWKYNAVVSIEQFPHQKVDPRVLLALVAVWMMEHDPERDHFELSDPDISVDVLGNDAADVMVELPMVEPIELVPDEAGAIPFQGQRYRVEVVAIDVAEEAELVTRGPDD